MSQQFDVVRWNREEQRGMVLFNHLKNAFGTWRSRQQNARRTDGQRKVKPVSQAVCEEELGHTEEAIAL